MAYDLDGEDRILVHRSRESVSGALTRRIRVRFLDDPADPELVLATGPDVDYPDFAVSSTGVYTAVWQDVSSTTTSIEMATCDAVADDCTDLANWSYDTVDTGLELRHPQVTTDGDRQFVVYMKNVNTAMSKQHRVQFATRCSAGAFTLDGVQTPAVVSWDQSLHWGRAHLGADRGDNVVHVAWVEADVWNNLLDQPGDSEAWWAARTYTDCP